jgi:N-methylhydantoinase A
MAAGVREVSVRRGYDPRDFPLVVAGGAGPVHAAAIARELEIPLIVIPRESSIFCAAGMLICDFKHDLVQACKQLLADLDVDDLAQLLAALAASGRTTLERELVPPERVRLRASLDLRYVGQWHELTLELDDEPGARVDLPRVEARFHEQHDALFGHHSADMPVEMLAARITAVGEVAKPSLATLDGGGGPEQALRATRDVWWPLERTAVETPVFAGRDLAAGSRLDGPAIVELEHTTAVVPSDFALAVDRFGSFVLFHGERGRGLASQLLSTGYG